MDEKNKKGESYRGNKFESPNDGSEKNNGLPNLIDLGLSKKEETETQKTKTMDFKEACEQLIIQGDLEKAIKHILDCLKNKDSNLYNMAILHSASINEANRKESQGTSSSEQISLARSRVKVAIQSLLSDMERDGILCEPIEIPVTKKNTITSDSKVTKILFLAANPKNTGRLRLDEEIREIEEKIRLSKFSDQFKFVPKLAVRIQDIMQALLDEEPNIIHFAGHGEEDGIQVEDVNGFPQIIPKEALALLFSEFASSIKCVVLNSCLSENQGREIAKYIPYVVGANKEIGDKASIAFAVGFYQALGAKKDIEQAFRLGQIAIALQSLPGKDIPVLIKR